MTLVNKARGLKKEAILGTAVAAAAQNAIGIPIARSKTFKKSVARSALQGASGKKAPRTAKSLATDAVAGVVAPEVNAAKNKAYKAGSDFAKKIGLDKANKRDLVVARLAAAGDEKGLKRIGKSGDKLAAKVRETKKKHGLPDISKKDIKKETASLKGAKDGYRVPASNKAAIAANAAIAPLPGGSSTALVNAAKLGASTEKFGKTKAGKALSKKFVENPVKASAKAGAKGEKYSAKAHWTNSTLLNPFTEEAKRVAHKAGSKVNKKA
ncbi:hypothetical protein VPHD148_0070 [Vibrio phage D148]